MIIGAKRKEEVIKMRSWGVYDQYIPMSMPVLFIHVSKNALGKWQVWEMVNDSAGQPIMAYRTKKAALAKAQEYAKKRGLEVKL